MRNLINFGGLIIVAVIFAVNYGKFDSIGKFEIKDFDTEEECLKQAEKLIHIEKWKKDM